MRFSRRGSAAGSASAGRSHASPGPSAASGTSAPELHLAPRRDGREVEQRAVAAGVAVVEVVRAVVPRDLEASVLHRLVEPGAAEDELAQPVDEGLLAEERDPLPVPPQVAAERAPRLVDLAVGGELDEVGDLVVVELARLDKPEPHGRRRHALFEIARVEGELKADELHQKVVSRAVMW